MQIKIKIKEVKKDHYDLSLKTYKHELTGTFEKAEIRNIIEKLDNAII
jgi:hypothetical protein